MREEAKIREMHRSGLKLRHPVGGDSLEEKKRCLKESLEDKKMINKLLRKACKKEPIKVSAPPAVTPAQMKIIEDHNADEKRKAMLARNQRQEASYGMKPALGKKSKSAARL